MSLATDITLALGVLQDPFRKAGFGEQEFHNQTVLHPLGLLAVLILGIACFTLPRRHAAIPFLILACFVSPAQRLIVATLDFHLLRLLVLAGWCRVLARGEYRDLRWIRLDSLVLAWGLVGAAIHVMRVGSVGAFIFRAGQTYDIVGMYLFFRCVIRDWRDVTALVRVAALVAIPMVALFAVEKATGRNGFSFFGGVPAITSIREGRLRCQGPFPHPILAGCYFAAWLPLVWALRKRQGGQLLAVSGFAAMTGIIVTTASSTPVSGFLAAGLAIAGWSLRRHMRVVRWSTLFTLIGLHLVMKAPVWHLISRLSFSRGSTSYHRFLLIDNAIRHFDEWALLGLNDTSHWGHAMYDLTNQYVREGVVGGFLALVLFVAMLATAFSLVGSLWRSEPHSPYRQQLAWGLGAALFVHCVMFLAISISHSQQNLMGFFVVLAAIGSLSSQSRVVLLAPRTSRRGPKPTAPKPTAPELEPHGTLPSP